MIGKIKQLIKKNDKLYSKLALINRIGFKLWFINIIFQRIFRRHSNLNFNVHFTSSIAIGENIKFHRDMNTLASFAISGNCYFQAINGITLGKSILFAPGVKLISSNHDMNNNAIATYGKPIIIGNNVWLGADAIILPEVEIGNNCIIGAGSIVTKSFKENDLVIAGNPARIIKKI